MGTEWPLDEVLEEIRKVVGVWIRGSPSRQGEREDLINDCFVRWLEVHARYEHKPLVDRARILRQTAWSVLLRNVRHEQAGIRGGGKAAEELIETVTPSSRARDEEARILVNDLIRSKLTPRERDVTGLLKHRRKATEIARELGLSRDQVVRITRSIRKKFEMAGLDKLLPR